VSEIDQQEAIVNPAWTERAAEVDREDKRRGSLSLANAALRRRLNTARASMGQKGVWGFVVGGLVVLGVVGLVYFVGGRGRRERVHRRGD
jgi:hypothetical protein